MRAPAIAFVLTVLAASPASAQTAPAEQRFDVDGDGKPDTVRVTEQAQLEIVLAAGGQSPWKAFTGTGQLTSARITSGHGKAFGGHVVIVAEASFRDGAAIEREAIAVRWERGKGRGAHGDLIELWRGPVGAIGRDGEWSVFVEATRYGLLRYRSVPGVERCDGEPAYIGVERYDFARGAFRAAAQPVRIADTAPVLTATATMPQAIATDLVPVAFHATASTTTTAPPREIDDGDVATAWVEDHAGFGRGEFVTFRSWLGPQSIVAIRIVPGHGASPQAFADHNRVRRLGLVIGGQSFWLDIPVDPAAQKAPAYWALLPSPVSAECATAIVDDIYPRDRARRNAGDTAIAELGFITELELSPAGTDVALAQVVAAGGKHATAAARLLASRGQPAATALIDQARRSKDDPAAVLRLRLALAAVPAGAEELCRGLSADSITAGEASLLSRGLVRLGPVAVSPLIAMLRDPASGPDAIARAIDALAKIAAPAAQTGLIEAAGAGSSRLRRRIADALGRRDPVELPLLVAAAEQRTSPAQEADLWRAAGVMARRAPPGEHRTRAAQAMAGRLANATGYELRTRLLAAAGGLDERAAIDGVRAAIERSQKAASTDPHEPALRRVAIGAIDGNRSDQAIALLEAATRDPDPGVRERAVSALAGRSGADAALIERLRGDRWVGVRRSAVAALGARCQRTAPRSALFGTAKTATEDAQVRAGALAGLVACRAAGIGNLLLALAADRKQPQGVRRPAVRLLGQLGDRSLTHALIDQFSAFRKRAWSNAESAALAATAANALCTLGDRAAVPTLADAAGDNSFPDIQAAAISALGCFCPRNLGNVLARAQASQQRPVTLALEGARQRCLGARRTR